MAPKKKKTKTVAKAAASADTGKRLTPEIRTAISEAPEEVTSTALSEKYGVSMQTIARYRNAAPTPAKTPTLPRATASAKPVKTSSVGGDFSLTTEGDYVVLKVPRERTAFITSLITSLIQ